MAKDTTSLDPLFAIPIGAEDEFTVSREYADPDSEFSETEETIDDSDAAAETELDVPNTFTIVSQKMNRQEAGNDTVDVVFTVGEVKGAVKYEIRVTRA